MSEQGIGLAGWGLYLPQGIETASELAEKAGLSEAEVLELGLIEKRVPGPDDHPVPMAVKAADEAFRMSGIDPAEVDLVLWTGEEYKDFIAQTASIRVQEEAGCKNAWAFDLVGQGTTLILGLRIARDMMLSDPAIRTVLLAGGTRNIDLVDYVNPETRFLLPLSASGGAIILKTGHDPNRLLDVAIEIDPTMADQVRVPGGGTETPFAEDSLDSPLMSYNVDDSELVNSYLEEEMPRRLVKVIDGVTGEGKPDFIALRHLPPGIREGVLNKLGLSDMDSPSLVKYGCHGTNNPLVGLTLGLTSGQVKAGQKVVLASSGIGFTYAAASIIWG